MLTIAGMLFSVFLSQSAAPRVTPFDLDLKLSEPVVFDKHVYPILAAKCLACHDRAADLAEGDLDLTTVAGIKQGGKSGPAIAPGDGVASRLVRLAAHAEKPFMPPRRGGKPLTSREVTILKVWIEQGARPGKNLHPTSNNTKQSQPAVVPEHVQPVYAVDMDASGTWLVAGRGKEIVFHELPSGKLLAKFAGPPELVYSLRLSRDRRWLAAGGYRSVKVWAVPVLPGGAWPAPFDLGPLADRVLALDFSPDSQLLAGGGGLPTSTGELMVWDLSNRAVRREFRDIHTDTVFGVAFHPAGNLIATASADKFLKVFDLATGQRVRSFEGHTHHVLAVAWNHDGKQLATAGADKTVRLWDYASGDPVRSINAHSREITGLRWIGTASAVATSGADRVARRVNVGLGTIDRTFAGADDFLYAVAVSNDGKRIAAGGEDGKIYVWDAASPKPLLVLSPPPTASRAMQNLKAKEAAKR